MENNEIKTKQRTNWKKDKKKQTKQKKQKQKKTPNI